MSYRTEEQEHEKLVYQYLMRSGSDKITVDGFTVTKDSFKLVEIDYKEQEKPCEVCSQGLICYYRFKAGRLFELEDWFYLKADF